MQNDWLDKLQSPLRPVRLEGWNETRLRITRAQLAFTLKERQTLTQIFRNETDQDAKQAALETLMELAVASPLAMPEVATRRRKKPECLADWLWGSFKARSAVLSVSDPRQLRRDENTLFTIGRYLAISEFPDLHDLAIELNDPHWQQLRVLQPQSLFLVGRLGLYGTEALKWWSPDHPRFAFLTHQRPEQLRPGDLDPDYHCVCERLPDGRTKRYQTRDEDGRRTDYCLVQRYVVREGTRQTVIVNCAGPTSLGTLGAVTWAADELARPARYDGKPIPSPKKLNYASRLEALLEVTAEITGCSWSPTHVKLLSLRVDDLVWSVEARDWRAESPGQIRVILQNGDPDRPVAILLDGKEPHMDRQAEAYRLLARLASKWHTRTEPGIKLSDLAADPWIWGGHAVDEHRARNRLKQVKQRYLRDVLLIADPISVLAETVIENQADANASPQSLQPALTPQSRTRQRKTSPAAIAGDRPPKRPR